MMHSVKNEANNFCVVNTSEGKILVHFEIRRSKKSKHFQLSYDPTGPVTLIIPWYASEQEAMQFLHCQGDWLNKQSKKKPYSTTLLKYLQTHQFISHHSSKLRVAFSFFKRISTLSFDETNGSVLISFDPQKDNDKQVKQSLMAFARTTIKEHSLNLAHRLKIEVKQIKVRDQSTVWGTCTEDSHLSFNWRLLLLAPELHDYVILHELTHLNHFDHSNKFWELLCHYDPKALTHDRKLLKISETIMHLGREC